MQVLSKSGNEGLSHNLGPRHEPFIEVVFMHLATASDEPYKGFSSPQAVRFQNRPPAR